MAYRISAAQLATFTLTRSVRTGTILRVQAWAIRVSLWSRHRLTPYREGSTKLEGANGLAHEQPGRIRNVERISALGCPYLI